MQGNIERLQFTKVPGRQAGFSPHFAAKPPLLWGYFEWLAYAKCFGISGPSSSLTGSNPVGDAKPFQQLTVPPPPLSRHKKGTILAINANAFR